MSLLQGWFCETPRYLDLDCRIISPASFLQTGKMMRSILSKGQLETGSNRFKRI